MNSNGAWRTALLFFLLHLATSTRVIAGELYVGVGSPAGASGAIYQYTPTGAESTFASGIYGAFGLVFDKSGNLYASGEDQIDKFTPSGAESVFAFVGSTPLGLTFDSNNNLFVACENEDIYKVTPGGSVSIFASLSPGSDSIYGLAFNASGNLFVSNYGLGGSSGGVLEFSPSGQGSVFASNLSGATGLAFNASGVLFVSEFASGNIYGYSPNGTRTLFASGLSDPEDIRFDTGGNLYEVDNASGSIHKFASAGSQSTFTSGLPSGLSGPHALAFDPVPEPSSWLLAIIGGIGPLVWCCRRRPTELVI